MPNGGVGMNHLALSSASPQLANGAFARKAPDWLTNEIREMPGFEREWIQLSERTVKIEAQQSQVIALLGEVREAQEQRRIALEALNIRVSSLESAAWTWAKFRAAIPQVAAFATLTAGILGLIVYLIKHLHL